MIVEVGQWDWAFEGFFSLLVQVIAELLLVSRETGLSYLYSLLFACLGNSCQRLNNCVVEVGKLVLSSLVLTLILIWCFEIYIYQPHSTRRDSRMKLVPVVLTPVVVLTSASSTLAIVPRV